MDIEKLQYLLTQDEMDKLKGDIESKEPEHTTALVDDLVQMLHKSRTEIFISSEHMGAEALNLQVKLDDIPIHLRQLIEKYSRTR